MEARNWSVDVQGIGNQIASLTLVQTVQLSEYLEEVHNIKPAKTGGYVPEEPQKEKEQIVPVQTEFAVSLDGFEPDKKIGLIKTVREMTSLGLKEAKDFVEACPKVVKEGLSKNDAETLKTKLEQAGGKVSLK